ncbi:hypothetical protein BY457_12710 [Marinilabilia salmonicolor]|jgi:hypothetical protein|nr:hypothetical protein BY457_12710 [Marinilabilia salmonicolor]
MEPTLPGKPKNKVVLSLNRLCLNLVRAASEMSFDDFDKRTVAFSAKADSVLKYCDK